MAENREPRRWALPSEAEGQSGRVERDVYAAWRKATLTDETEDLPLRLRLLEEESQALRTRAGDRTMRGLESLTVQEHMDRMALERDARDGGAALPVDERAAKWEAQAAELEDEAREVAQYLAEHAPVVAPRGTDEH